MAKVKYLPGDTEQFGYVFAAGEAVDVTDERHLRKFRGNPHFEVDGSAEPPSEDDDRGLHAVHKGRGVYAVMRDGTEVESGLSKEDADAFNAMSEAEQASYLEKN